MLSMFSEQSSNGRGFYKSLSQATSYPQMKFLGVLNLFGYSHSKWIYYNFKILEYNKCEYLK